MAWYRNFVARTIILAMLVGVNGRYFGQRKAANKGSELDPATSRLVKLLQKQTQIDKLKQNFSSPQVIQDFVLRKFKTEMVQLFTFLPKIYRCNIVRNLSRTSHCNGASITRILSRSGIRNTSKLKCEDATQTVASKCSGRNITKVVIERFWNQLGHLFNSVSIPFQCSIVNKISSSSSSTSSKRRRLRQNHFLKGKSSRVSIQVVEKELEKRFTFLNLKQNCSRVWKPLKDKVPPKSPAALVNVTVQLDHRRIRTKKAWIRRFKRKAHKIYQIYYDFHFQTMSQRPINAGIHASNPPLLSSIRVRLNVIKVTKVNRSIVAVFALEVKKPGSIRYSKITPAKQIITPLQRESNSDLRRLFGGTVVHLSGRKSDSLGKGSYKWLKSNSKKAAILFPKHLVSYYRSLDRLGRCLVMLYISSILQLELRPVEMFYTLLTYAPKKYFCSSTPMNLSPQVIIGIFYRANETRFIKTKNLRPNKTNKKFLLTNTGRLNVTTSNIQPSEFPDLAVLGPSDETEEHPDTREGTPLEIGLFVVLALLCVAILVFTVNCVIFAVKKNSPSSEHEPNTAFAQAVQLRKVDIQKSKGESESHLQLALLTYTGEGCKHTKKERENVKKRCSKTQDLCDMPEETLENDSLKEATLHSSNSTNEYSEDPLSSIQNLQKNSSEQHVSGDTLTCENENSDKTADKSGNDDDDDLSDSDDNDCSTNPSSSKIRTTRI